MRVLLVIVLALIAHMVAWSPRCLAQPFDAQSDGSDGPLTVGANMNIDLRLATTGSWQDPSPVPGQGIYDPTIWAVIFKYSSVSITAGTVTFTNHPSGAPVVWLVQGDVVVGAQGTVNLSGANGAVTSNYSEPGPGGFAGGRGSSSNGFGPGGGSNGNGGGGAGYALAGGTSNTPGTGGAAYGNLQLIPLMGGSGGASDGNRSGGAGGGAILIASSTQVLISGTIVSGGGTGSADGLANGSGSGSGGAVRLVSNTVDVTGSNRITVTGNGRAGDGGAGSAGRIRIEAHTLNIDAAAPSPSNFPHYSTAVPGPIFQDTTTPDLRLVSANGVAVTADPLGGVQSIDTTLRPSANPIALVIQAANVVPGSIVEVKVFQATGNPIVVQSTPLVGSMAMSTATASVNLTPGVPGDIVLKVLP